MKKAQFLLPILMMASSIYAQQTIEQGKNLFNGEQYSKAKQVFLDINKQKPNEEAYYYLGEIYFLDNKIDSAASAYQQGVNTNSKYLYNYTGLGKVALQKGNTAAANENFEKAKKGGKKDSQLLLSIVQAAVATQNKDTALARLCLSIVEEKDPKLPLFHIVTGDFNFQTKNFGKAINDYNNALYYGADAQTVSLRLGALYTRINNFKEAENAYNQIISTNPNAAIAYKKIGDLYYTYGKYEKAKTAYTTYFSKVSPTEDDKEKFALILFFNKNYDQTESLIKEIAAQNQDNAVLFRVRAYTAYERADYENGIKYINQLFSSLKPERVIALDYLYYAKLLSQTGKDSLAINNYLKAYNLDTAKYDYLEEVAKIYVKNKRHDKAIEYYAMLTKNPQQDKAALAYIIGKEYYFSANNLKHDADSLGKKPAAAGLREKSVEQYLKADSCFSNVIILSPKFTAGYLWKARSLALVDPDAKSDKAKKAYEALLAAIQSSGTPDNNSTIECYRYLASYYYLQYERESNGESKRSLKRNSMDYFEKILSLSPSDKQASESLNLLKK
jgi:tetratricopeptide (TPR) repeat protein